MHHLTVRDVPDEVARALAAERERRGTSLNRTVIDLLAAALGVSRVPQENGLRELAGTWTDADLAEFEVAVAPFDRPDAELWR